MKYFACFSVGAFLLTSLPVSAATKAPVKKVAVKKTAVKKTTKKVSHITVSAIPGKDEKKFSNPATRCLTAGMNSLHDKAVQQMQADIKKAGAGYESAAKSYEDDIATIWAAMFEPYCGYGSRGIAAVQHSFEKSVAKTRARFMAALKAPPVPMAKNNSVSVTQTLASEQSLLTAPDGSKIQF
ncbi:MAG TPA: hypothetical protein VFQ60_03970 [Patescibacteria group bacterium]|nr:hypothetical protein [Patescibacteria group bacterium]